MTRRPVVLALVALFVAVACSGPGGGPILANPTAPRPSLAPTPTAPAAVADPQPIVLPRDDGPHDRLTEWWYFTGHLAGAAGDGVERRFGFEYVIFRAERGAFPPAWVSHLAITDETGDAFHYAQRQEIGPQVDRSPRDADGVPTGFELALSGFDPTDPTSADA
jgi:predicted secreted hydrolase